MASTKNVLSTVASLAASAMLAKTIVNDFLPPDFQNYMYSSFRNLLNRYSSELTIIIEDFEGFSRNEVYDAVEIYLGTRVSPSVKRIRVSKAAKEKNLTVSVERHEEVIDVFEGIQLRWRLICSETQRVVFKNHGSSAVSGEIRFFQLCFHKKHQETVMGSYFPWILKQAKSLKAEKTGLKLHTMKMDYQFHDSGSAWTSVVFNHPATFQTLAMDLELKETIMEDLKRFLERREFYARVGKAWKRGYLLYGPPGTGKTSLIAAMANFLKFDIYDLELTNLRSNSDLRRLLLNTANRSILVVEDIDCTTELHDRSISTTAPQDNGQNEKQQVTLSGVLNFVDGLWSSCGDERIIVFTTNHKERLDPALLRPGRMDLHIHMSFCRFSAFKVLVSNYLSIHDHLLFREVEKLIEKIEITPAEVAEELMRSDDPDIAVGNVVEALQRKEKEAMEEKEKQERVEERDGERVESREEPKLEDTKEGRLEDEGQV